MERYFEDPLQFLLKDNQTARDDWYKARYFVRNVLQPLDGNGIAVNSNKRVHVVLKFDTVSKLLMAVVRQICLVAHYPNFNDETGDNATLITICCNDNVNAVYDGIKTYPYLGNLLNYCQCRMEGEKDFSGPLFLDIKFEFVETTEVTKDDIVIEQKQVEESTSNLSDEYKMMDVTMGMLVNMVYLTGSEIDNLSANDNANIERYSTALNVFCYKLKQDTIVCKWKECAKPQKDGSYNPIDIKNKLSSIFCADCFETRIKGLLDDTSEKSVAEYLLCDFETVVKKVFDEKTITAIARCEHSRWNVEKLMLDFKPLSMEDWYDIESHFGSERNAIIKRIKAKGRHIDICSYKNLRRVHPANMKYDFFLMLAMPQIMRSYLLAK